jgi:hypothetical protein
MVSSHHVPDSIALLGMVAGVVFLPIVVLATLFLIDKLVVGR